MSSGIPTSAGELQNSLKLADAAIRRGDGKSATRIASDAVRRGHEHPVLLTLAAYFELNARRPQDALVLAQRARTLEPRNVDTLQALATILGALGRNSEAIAVCEQALRLAPGVTSLRYNCGRLMEDMGEMERARRDYERVVDAVPNHGPALSRLAAIAAIAGQSSTARNYAQRALRANPKEMAARIALAQADLQDGNLDAVMAAMKPLADDANAHAFNRSIAQGLVADVLDARGEYAQAFEAYQACNRSMMKQFAPVHAAPGAEPALERARRTAAFLSDARAEDWCGEAQYAGPASTHVFLLGFPRSGTTLLEQVLGSNSAIETMEERDALIEIERDFFLRENRLGDLFRLSGDDLDRYRQSYWKIVHDRGVALDRPVFIDKMPLNSLLLPAIAKLFPQARILLAVRDPRDVVLSSFKRRFGMSDKMYELLSLSRAADFYAAAMQICDLAQNALPMPFRVTRYEDLVRDFEREAGAICEFLGVEYDPAMKNFSERARSHRVNTPSATQVRQDLYTQGMDQWRVYRDQMAPVLPVLAPWVRKFGYAEE